MYVYNVFLYTVPVVFYRIFEKKYHFQHYLAFYGKKMRKMKNGVTATVARLCSWFFTEVNYYIHLKDTRQTEKMKWKWGKLNSSTKCLDLLDLHATFKYVTAVAHTFAIAWTTNTLFLLFTLHRHGQTLNTLRILSRFHMLSLDFFFFFVLLTIFCIVHVTITYANIFVYFHRIIVLYPSEAAEWWWIHFPAKYLWRMVKTRKRRKNALKSTQYNYEVRGLKSTLEVHEPQSWFC